MITCPSSLAITDMPFQEYLKLEGYSHSFLKYQKNGVAESKEATVNMQIGTMVDQILTEPAKVDMSHELYKEAKQIAHSLTSTYGEMINAFKKQVSYTGVFHYAGFQLPVKGRLDFLIPKHAVVDLKVTWSKDVLALIEYMGYKNQLFAYCKMAGVKKGYIMIHSAPLNKTTIVDIAIPDTNEFWQEQILNFGTVIQ